jgi:adenylate cyclase
MHPTATERRATANELIARHRGRVVDTAGDSILAEFGSVVDAVECAWDVQRAAARANSALEPAHRMQLRIGVHLGDVLVKGRELFGDGINTAARLQALAEPGGICISSAVYDQVRRKLPLEFTDIGPQFMKNIAEPVHAYKIRNLLVESAEGTEVSSASLPPPSRHLSNHKHLIGTGRRKPKREPPRHLPRQSRQFTPISFDEISPTWNHALG